MKISTFVIHDDDDFYNLDSEVNGFLETVDAVKVVPSMVGSSTGFTATVTVIYKEREEME
ncbi:hypothetical protein [Lacticaseibacillus saniviri]